MTEDRCRGALLGLAVSNAVETMLGFRARVTFDPTDDRGGGGPFDLQPGQWTHDTAMALRLGASRLHRGGFDARAQMDRYWNGSDSGPMSSTGTCLDIGSTVSAGSSRYTAESSRTTHRAAEAVASCSIVAEEVIKATNGVPGAQLLDVRAPDPRYNRKLWIEGLRQAAYPPV